MITKKISLSWESKVVLGLSDKDALGVFLLSFVMPTVGSPDGSLCRERLLQDTREGRGEAGDGSQRPAGHVAHQGRRAHAQASNKLCKRSSSQFQNAMDPQRSEAAIQVEAGDYTKRLHSFSGYAKLWRWISNTAVNSSK